jgi:hypothetical protein
MNVNLSTHNSYAQSAVKFTPKHSDFAVALGSSVAAPPLISRTAEQREERAQLVQSMQRSRTREEFEAELATAKAKVRLTPEEQSQIKDGNFGVAIGADNLPTFIAHLEEAAANGESLASAMKHWQLNYRSGWTNSDWDSSEGAVSSFTVCTHTGQVRHHNTTYSFAVNPFAPPKSEAELTAHTELRAAKTAAQNAAVPQFTTEIHAAIQRAFFNTASGEIGSAFDDVLNM